MIIRVLHVLIIGTLLGEALYCCFQVFVVLQPPGSSGPLWFDAANVPLEVLVGRRLYAIEGWLAFIGLCLYVGITEVVPRRLTAATAPTP